MKDKLWTLGIVIVGVLIAAPIAGLVRGLFGKKPAAPSTVAG